VFRLLRQIQRYFTGYPLTPEEIADQEARRKYGPFDPRHPDQADFLRRMAEAAERRRQFIAANPDREELMKKYGF